MGSKFLEALQTPEYNARNVESDLYLIYQLLKKAGKIQTNADKARQKYYSVARTSLATRGLEIFLKNSRQDQYLTHCLV